jgi:hypothetical protein
MRERIGLWSIDEVSYTEKVVDERLPSSSAF